MDQVRIDNPEEQTAGAAYADWLHDWATTAGLTPEFLRARHFVEDLPAAPARQ